MEDLRFYSFNISLLTILFERYLWEMDLNEYIATLMWGCISFKYTYFCVGARGRLKKNAWDFYKKLSDKDKKQKITSEL